MHAITVQASPAGAGWLVGVARLFVRVPYRTPGAGVFHLKPQTCQLSGCENGAEAEGEGDGERRAKVNRVAPNNGVECRGQTQSNAIDLRRARRQ